MKNRKLILIVSLVLAMTMSLGGTLAYLSDTDADVNTMVLGNVKIEQHEYQRVGDETDTYTTKELNGKTGYELEGFQDNKMLLPIVGDPNESSNSPAYKGWDDTRVYMDQVDSYGNMQVFAGKNAVDKFVTVENTGNTPAYVRTYVALEVGSTENKTADGKPLVMTAGRYTYKAEEAVTVAPWMAKSVGIVEINGNNYSVIEMTYVGAKLSDGSIRHEGGKLPGGDTTYPSLTQVYLKHYADNKDVIALDGNANGKYDILVLSQAVQADGFAATAEKSAAQVALEAGFGEATEANVKAWFEQVPVAEDEIDTSWYDKDAVEFVLTTAEELHGFAKLVNEEGVSFKGKTVKLGANINLANQKWTPIGQTGNAVGDFLGVFDGQGYTISNLYVDSSDKTDGHYSSGLFGWVENHGQGITIKDLTIEGAKIVGHHNTGVIAGYMYGDVLNCTVKNAEIINTHANDDACGDKAGAIVGYAGDGTYSGNSAIDCTVTAGRDAGQLFGCVIKSQMQYHSNNTATNVVVKATGDCTGANVNNDIYGRIP